MRGEIDDHTIVTDYRETDARIRDLSGRIELVADPEVESLGVGAAIVEVSTRDGRRLRGVAAIRKGDARNPFSPAEIERKFVAFAARRIGHERAERVMALVRDLEQLDDTARLVALLAE